MNQATKKHLETLDTKITKALIECSIGMKNSVDGIDDSFDAMGGMIEVLAEQHCHTVWALIGSTLEMNKEGMFEVPNGAMRETINTCISSFSEALIEGIAKSCKLEGYPNPLDPNGTLREEILNGDL